MVFFFFSSRRRHTRLQGDWSSDVCSSDLGADRKRVLRPDLEQRFDEAVIAGAPNQRKHSILVVDDEPMALELLHGVLTEAGYEVSVAQSGFECLDLFRRDAHAFDLILTDLSMPLMDGEETFERLRQMSPTVNVVL